jgi:myo-inositol 2-dehydrogenase / D-chiro-inositol 1-dehydrogenase
MAIVGTEQRARAGVKAGPPLRIGVLGVGRIGRMHAELLAHHVKGTEVAAVCDFVPDLAQEVGEDVGAEVASGPEELIGDPGVDAVAICSSTHTHADLIVAAAEAGKAIFCEKPISLELAEVDRALDAVAAARVPFQVGFNRRFDPAHRSVREAVVRGSIGQPHLVRISSRDPAPPPFEYVRVSGGIFLDMTGHDFDLARYITGSEVVEVFARGAVRVEPSFAEADDVDTALVMLVHEDGCLTAIDNSRRAVYGYDQRVEAFGSRGMACSQNPLAHTGVVYTADGTSAPTLPYFFLERYIPSYLAEWEAFVGAVRSGAEPPVGGADGRAPLVIGLAARRSLHEGGPVAVSEVEA